MVERPPYREPTIDEMREQSTAARTKLTQSRRVHKESKTVIKTFKDKLIDKLRRASLKELDFEEISGAFEILHDPHQEENLAKLEDQLIKYTEALNVNTPKDAPEQVLFFEASKARQQAKLEKDITEMLRKEIVTRLTETFSKTGLMVISIKPQISNRGLKFVCTFFEGNSEDHALNDVRLESYNVKYGLRHHKTDQKTIRIEISPKIAQEFITNGTHLVVDETLLRENDIEDLSDFAIEEPNQDQLAI